MSTVKFEFDSTDQTVCVALVKALEVMRDTGMPEVEFDGPDPQVDDTPTTDQPEIDVPAALGEQVDPTFSNGANQESSVGAVAETNVTSPSDQPDTASLQPEIDKMGIPWDSRIHAGTKTKTVKGIWKRLKGIDDSLYDQVIAELKALMGGTPDAANVVEQPVAVPPVVEQPVAVPPVTTATSTMTYPNFINKVVALKNEKGDIVTTTLLGILKRDYSCESLPMVNNIPDKIGEIWNKLESECALLG